MEQLEFFIWSALTGALLFALLASVLNWALARSSDAAQGVTFILVTGAGVVLLSGLPEYILRISDPRSLLPLKVFIGPLASAFALVHLGSWLGIMREDVLVGRTVRWGSAFMALCAAGLLTWSLLSPQTNPTEILAVAGLVCGLAVVLGTSMALRGARLGDSLATKMCVAAGLMGVMVGGMYAKAMQYQGGLWFWVMIALAIALHYLLMIGLTIERIRERARLHKLAKGSFNNDAITGLPTGAALVSKVDDSIWRAVRLNRSSVVMAVWVSNLYSLREAAGREVDQEIHTILAARMRRAVGFRNVVGLYHPRCYIVAIIATSSPERIYSAAQKTYAALVAGMVVGSIIGRPHKFMPDLGMSVVNIPAGGAEATHAMNQAERLAQNAASSENKLLFADLSSDPIEVDTSFDQITSDFQPG